MAKTMVTFDFYQDPGHGWLEVDRGLLSNLGIEREISVFSYQKDNKVYLEEDCDARVLVEKLESQGVKVTFNVIHQTYTPIRGYNSFKA